jgi:hypothetical protein
MLSEAVAALAGPLDRIRLVQIAKPVIDPGLLPPARDHEFGDGQAGQAGVGEHGQQPGHLWVAVARLARHPATQPGRDRVGVAAARGRRRLVAARAGLVGGVAGGCLGGNRIQPGGGVGVMGGQLVDLGAGSQIPAGGPGAVETLAARVWEVEGTTGWGAGLVRLLAQPPPLVVELAAPSGQPAAMGHVDPLDAWRPEDWAMGRVQSVIVSASTVRSGADSTEPTRDRPFPQLRQFH